MKKIAIIDLFFNWPPVGGSWVDVKEIAQRLPEYGYEVKLFVPDWTDYYPRGVIKTDLPFPVEKIKFNRLSYNFIQAPHRLRKAVEKWGADIVWFGDGAHFKGNLLNTFSDYPTVFRFYAYEILCLNFHYWLYDEHRICDGGFLVDPERCDKCWHPGNTFYKRLYRILFGLDDLHPRLHFSQEYIFSLGFTKWYQKNIKKWLGSASAIVVYNDFIKKMLEPFSSNIHVISSGVDTRKFIPPTEEVPETKPIKILMIGRTNDYLKGFWSVKDALKILWQKRQDFELLVTAAFNLEFDEPYIKNLGWLTPEEVQKVYHLGQINLVPSIWVEPFGITAVEAMACGLPVIASNMGGPAISTVDNETGILVEPGNAEKLAEAINRFLDNPDLRRKMGAAARKRAEDVFDWDVIVKEKYIPLLSKIF